MLKFVSCWLVLFLTIVPMLAQNGDKKGEVQLSRVPAEKIPPSPPLSPAAALKTFKLQPGFEIQTFAHEPVVQVPIALQFDPDGRMWVLEMRSFMPNPDGLGEDAPAGRVSILEDTNGDGVADKNKVFLDGLILPRAFLLAYGGLLVAEPPKLWFYPIQNDTPGERVLVDDDFAKEGDPRLGTKSNPEHSANSLTLAMDNWIYSLYHTRRYRFEGGKWLSETMPKRAQWGMSQDNYGRLFYTSNSDQLRGDLVPSHYMLKVGPNAKVPGVGVQIAKDQSVWPVRVNPGVNRGYQTGTLREDGTLWKFTAACGPSIYRGDALPSHCVGNAFVCEPSANVVRRNLLIERDGMVTASNAYEQAEFLASTDELFRPVNTYTGPDGALYIVDMYHGIIQHRVFLTSYLRSQAESRGLQKITNYGRIYRVTSGARKQAPKRLLTVATPHELLEELSHPNGWIRDTAQRLLIERKDPTTVQPLVKMASSHADVLARLHALWTLEGMGRLEAEILTAALGDKEAKLRAAAIRMSESLLRTNAPGTEKLRSDVMGLAWDTAADVQIQLALSLGEMPPDAANKSALALLAKSPVSLAKDAAAFSMAAREPVKMVTKAKKPALSPEEQKRIEAGKANYEVFCLPCHQPHGLGQEGLAPPLVGSEWVSGSEQVLARIVLNGLRGPIQVKGQTYEMDMPGLGVLEDEQIATVLTYIRNEWGHSFPPISSKFVKQVRDQTADRSDAWTQEELLKVK